MKSTKGKSWLVVAGLAAAFITPVLGQQIVIPAATVTASDATKQERVIVVSLEDHKLALVEGGQVKKVYTVAVGKPSTPSPEGNFTIARRVKNPVYQHDGKTIQPGPRNPVGTRWMGLSVHGYGIHGTNEPKSIGKAASHGCIRMAKADLEELYEMVEVGDKVELVGHRDEQTLALFGPAPAINQPNSTGAVQTAKAEPAADAASKVEAQIASIANGTR
ncbi:L,D-transpeptidase [Acidicapsa dinghuensis]|uniref:L,D-transpeptidase n=1 Tax=Acidicapsa dinghuensis TaxID=2218256 RepID=A0ABW1EPJ1_9BACT|nr:L,D-transpeptidase [Acidicapsa dinghuensis]